MQPANPNMTRRRRSHRMRGRYATGRAYLAAKRVLDVLAAGAGLVLLSPLLTFCALWIWGMDGRPVFYYQWRVGEEGWLFRIYKFRTMRRDAERDGKAAFAMHADPRVIPGCGWMRRSHVDELPQLWNILTGDMSLVGPRPERPEMMEELLRDIPRMEERLVGRPGLTGLAQLANGYTHDLAGARRKLAFDLRYLRRRSLLAELRLVLGTLPKVWDNSAC